jgi:hypothetical protein
MFLEKRPERFQARMIHIGQETAQAGPMWQASASEQCHKCSGEGSYSLKEVRKAPLSTARIADEQRKKIDGPIRCRSVVVLNGSAGQRRKVGHSLPGAGSQ